MEIRERSLDRYYRLRGVPPEARPVRDPVRAATWREEFARRWRLLVDELGEEKFFSRIVRLVKRRGSAVSQNCENA